jgi:hypothetical protein
MQKNGEIAPSDGERMLYDIDDTIRALENGRPIPDHIAARTQARILYRAKRAALDALSDTARDALRELRKQMAAERDSSSGEDES